MRSNARAPFTFAIFFVFATCIWSVPSDAVGSRILYTSVVGGGEVVLDPPGGTYANNTTVNITAQPHPGWMFTHWTILRLGSGRGPDDPAPGATPVTSYANPEAVTLKATNILVTAHFRGPQLTIDITGQGSYSLIPPPPSDHVGYVPGTPVKVVFHPSGGQLLTNTFPYVSPPQGADPGPQWIFSHWSPSPGVAWQFGHPGVEPVASVVMDTDKTLYGTFVYKGSTAHPTDEQEVELMNIARGSFGSWSGLSPAQAVALQTKADNYYRDEKEHYQWWGQVAGAVWFNDFGRTSPGVLDKLGEGTTWTGMHLAAMALKHAVMPGCADTLAAINVSLDALDKCTWVTGTPGRVARFSGPADHPAYQWYYAQAGNLGVYPSAAPYEGEVWIGWPSRDVHTGLFVGLAAALELVQDQSTWNKARMITERVVDRLVLDGWLILDGYNITTNNATLLQLQHRVAYRANPLKYGYLLPGIVTYTGVTPTTRPLNDSLYWDTWLTWSRAWAVTLLEWDPARKASYQTLIRNAYHSANARTHMNPFYAAIATYHDPGGLAADAYATLQGYLLCHPDPPKRYWRSDLATDPRYTFRDSNHVWEPALAHHRAHADFDGMRSAAKTNDGHNSFGYTYSGWEFNLYYWMGRHSGAIPAPAGDLPGVN